MFDDLKQQNNQANTMPQNQSMPPQNPVQPVAPAQTMTDMFDSVDPVSQSNLGTAVKPSAVQSGKIKPVSNTSYTPSQPGTSLDPMMFTEASGNKLNKIIIILVVALLLVALGFGAYYFIVRGKLALPSNNQNTNQEVNTNNNADANTNEADMTDSDADGLTDEEEAQYNTNALLADTDGDDLSDREEIKTYATDPLIMDTDNDGLNDGEEVKVWGTDPKNADTDGDSYPDGTEVKNGYSPTGPGKLSTSTTAINTDTEVTENPQFSAAVLWGIPLLTPISQCYQASKTSVLTNYLAGADICNPKINQNWPPAPDAYPKVCVLDKVIQDNTWSIGLQSNSPDTLKSVICNQNGCQAASVAEYPTGKVCP